MLQILVVSIVVGIAALKVGAAADPFLAFNRSFLKIVHKILWWVIRLTPIGTIGLLGNAVRVYGWDALAQLGWFSAPSISAWRWCCSSSTRCCCSAHGLNPIRYFQSAWPAIQLAFVSRSSIGTLPVTERITEENLGVPREYAAFAVPLGATTKMDGCAAIYPAISAIFVAQFFGVPLGIEHYLLIVFVSVIGSAATAGLTGATVMLTLTLSTLGLPLEGVGLLLAVDPILDMGRTAVNVAGQALIPTIVAKRQGILDQAAYDRGESIEALDAEHAPCPRNRTSLTCKGGNSLPFYCRWQRHVIARSLWHYIWRLPMLDHIGLRTNQFETMLAFYKAALAPLGYAVMAEYPGTAGFGREYPDFWIGADDKGGSNIHLAFKTDDRAVVDAFHRRGTRQWRHRQWRARASATTRPTTMPPS